MPKKFKPQDVAQHRATYKKILQDARVFVGTTMLENFTPALYSSHLRDIIKRLGDEHASLEEKADAPNQD